ncbi:hypothetical protein H4R19_001454 [Coemansia spiralis]|nr:hypothetical protein H4R19_001454 [Coemansia spiralis]
MPHPPYKGQHYETRWRPPTTSPIGIRVTGAARRHSPLPTRTGFVRSARPPHSPPPPPPPPERPAGAPSEFHTYWCNTPGPCLQVEFEGDWVLPLVEGGHTTGSAGGSGKHLVVVRGVCPLHVIAVRNSDNTADCGGINTHVHVGDTLRTAGSVTVTGRMAQLAVPLVTTPIPLSALLQFAALRRVSMYYIRNRAWLDGIPKRHAPPEAAPPPIISLEHDPPGKLSPNPVCRRMLERLAHEKQWKLDESPQFSIDSWTNTIDHNNILLFSSGVRVPCPPGEEFKAAPEVYRVAIGFWSPFQQQMWEYFLSHSTGPCYLDAAYRCDKDGFQLWTLFFERSGQAIPVAYLVTTAATVSLIADWLTAIVDRSPDALPKKVLYVNTLRVVSALSAVLGTWDVRLCKYYIDQMLKDALRSKSPPVADQKKAQAIRNVEHDFAGALEAAKEVLTHEVAYMFDQANDWGPKSADEVLMFMQGSQAVSRWRYLLWTQMIGRSPTVRIDSVLYYLHSILTPGVEQAVRALDTGGRAVGDFCTERLEQGSGSLIPELRSISLKPMGGSLMYVANYSNIETSQVVATDFSVCFCDAFSLQGMCQHLIHWATPAIHQPELIRLLDGLPRA